VTHEAPNFWNIQLVPPSNGSNRGDAAAPMKETSIMTSHFRSAAVAIALSLGAVACGGNNPPPAAPAPTGDPAVDDFNSAPAWVRQSCKSYWGDQGKGRVCAVGSMGGSRNVGLLRSGAAGRARTEIARSLQTKVAALLKDYQRTVTGGENFGKAASDEQLVQDTSKQLTDMTLSGTEQVDSWIGPKSGTMYVLVQLNTEAFGEAVSKMKELDAKTREYVVRNSNKAFDDLQSELDKARQ
jgi:hypothetical protein